MKKFLFLAVLLLVPTLVMGQSWLLGETLYERQITINTISPSTGVESVLELDMKAKAGIVLSVTCDGSTSDDFEVWIYDYDMDSTSTNQTWHSASNRDDETILVYSYDGSVTSWRDDDPFAFSSDDTTNESSLYIGAYNSDSAATLDLDCKLRYKGLYNTDYGTVTYTE